MASQSAQADDWAHLSGVEGYGRETTASEHSRVDYSKSMTEFPGFRHASHGMIYSSYKGSQKLFGLHTNKAWVLMTVRFDGKLGFPGGLVDEGESPVEALNRECKEELDTPVEKVLFEEKHHGCTFVHEKKKLVLHCFALEVDAQTFKEVEGRALSAADWGLETMGILRVPLYTMGEDEQRGLPVFLGNCFAGNAREQLLICIVELGILSLEEVNRAVDTANSLSEHTSRIYSAKT